MNDDQRYYVVAVCNSHSIYIYLFFILEYDVSRYVTGSMFFGRKYALRENVLVMVLFLVLSAYIAQILLGASATENYSAT